MTEKTNVTKNNKEVIVFMRMDIMPLSYYKNI